MVTLRRWFWKVRAFYLDVRQLRTRGATYRLRLPPLGPVDSFHSWRRY